ncbi:TPA: hypothetical protein L4R51_002353 [Pseudomonas aeruginosa]|nr:hypothetical protein [Pseudomonas aeruginosa]
MSNELTDVRCPCGAEFQADSYDAGFIAGSGMCQNCDAALPPKDICTCPSGDGSLRWPCPKHPAVEQAGGDERAAQWHECTCPKIGEKWNPAKHGKDCPVHQARAALAQPSPASDLDPFNLAPHAEAFNEAPDEALKPDQAEAERPKIVATLFTPNEKVHDDIGFKAFAVAGDCDKDGGEFYDPEKLMTVAQHERIVVALTCDHAHVEEHLSQQIDILRINLAAKRDNLDAALAEVERLRQFERICEGLPQDAIDGCWTVQGIRGYAKLLEDQLKSALARVAELTATRNRYGVDAHYFNKNLQRILRNFESFTPDELARSLIILAKVADEKVVAQAQHSVPEGWKLVPEDATLEMVEALKAELVTTSKGGILRAGIALNAAIAAAPGKEGV